MFNKLATVTVISFGHYTCTTKSYDGHKATKFNLTEYGTKYAGVIKHGKGTKMAFQFGRLSEFVKRNIVLFVMIPTIVGIHWGWSKLQEIEEIAGPRKQQHPIAKGYNALKNKYFKEAKSD